MYSPLTHPRPRNASSIHKASGVHAPKLRHLPPGAYGLLSLYDAEYISLTKRLEVKKWIGYGEFLVSGKALEF